MQKFDEHYKYLGGDVVFDEVSEIRKQDNIFYIKTLSKEYKSKTLILAAGTVRRKLNVPGEAEFLGKGVSYCATCDAFFFKGKKVGVVGGSDAAASAAVLLAQYASEVYIIYRRDKLRAEPYWIEKIEKASNIKIIYNTIVREISGSQKMEYVVFQNGDKFELDGLFVEIGSFSSTEFANALGMEIADNGDIIVNAAQETNVQGLYAAGDITTGSNGLNQIITAAAEGSIAAESAYKFLR
jgi:thioredoxin reductase (NADPH)